MHGVKITIRAYLFHWTSLLHNVPCLHIAPLQLRDVRAYLFWWKFCTVHAVKRNSPKVIKAGIVQKLHKYPALFTTQWTPPPSPHAHHLLGLKFECVVWAPFPFLMKGRNCKRRFAYGINWIWQLASFLWKNFSCQWTAYPKMDAFSIMCPSFV